MRGGRRLSAYGQEYRRTWRGRLVCLLLLAPVVWLSVLLVRVPSGSALTVPALLLDRLVVVSTAVVLPAAVFSLLVLPARPARTAATVGGVVSALVGLPTIIAALGAPRKTLPTALAVASLICGAALMAVLLFASFKGRRWRLSFLAPLLAVLPLVQFWQATSYTPSQLLASISPEVDLTVQKVGAEERQGVIEVSFENAGDVKAAIFMSRVIYCFVTEDEWQMRNLDVPGLLGNAESGKCTYEPLLFSFSPLDPQQVFTYTLPWRAPTDKSFAIIAMDLYYAREDRVRLDPEITTQPSAKGCEGPATIYRLIPRSRFEAVVKPTRLVVFNQSTFFVGYAEENADMCDPESFLKASQELGITSITDRMSDWLNDAPEHN